MTDTPTPNERCTCPGCGEPSDGGPCGGCEYNNVVTGRSHYCGRPSCYCRGLRQFMLPEFLERYRRDLGEQAGVVSGNGETP